MNGDLIACFAHKQPAVAVPSTVAEYVVVTDACKYGLNTFHFTNEFVQIRLPIHILMNKLRVMYMACNLVTKKRSSHIDHRYHLIRDCSNKGIIKL